MQTYTVEEAQQCLGDIIDRALQGEQITIVKDSKFMVLEERLFSEPIPERPLGYFDNCDDEEETRRMNNIAEHSIREIVP